MISKIEICVNNKQTQLRIDNRFSSQPEITLVKQLKDLAEKYFSKSGHNQLEITYILWTEAISFEELESGDSIEADCLEVFFDQKLQDRQVVVENNLGKLLFLAIQNLAIEAQKSQLLKRRFLTEQELGITDWKIKNTWFGNAGSLIEKKQNQIRPNVYYRADNLIFASTPSSPDQIIFLQPLGGLGKWIADESQRYLMMISPEKEADYLSITLLDTQTMIKQKFVNPSFLEKNKIA